MGLEQPLRSMLAPVAEARPPAAALAGCAYFQGDVQLRALKVRCGAGEGRPAETTFASSHKALAFVAKMWRTYALHIRTHPHTAPFTAFSVPASPLHTSTTPPPPPLLQFLDTLIQRDALQKAAFLRDLPALCAQFDSRVLRYKARGCWGRGQGAVAGGGGAVGRW